jgi:probable HAF family extracellular repeat protein
MKSGTLMSVTSTTLFVALAIPLAAQGNHNHHKQHHYHLIDLGTFGGPSSYLATSNGVTSPGAVNQVLNNQGTVVGWGDTSTPDPFAPNCFNPFPPDCFLPLAFRWQEGVLTDLGVLPGGDASTTTWISDTGLIAGQARIGLIDPRFGFPEWRAVLWKAGQIIDLGTLGGNESSAFSVNNRGQVVGFSTSTIPDPFSFLGTQLRAFLWQHGAMQDLGTLGGPEAWALFVNERGQVAGFSMTDSTPNSVTDACGTNVPTTDPFIWDKEHGMTDLGTLGGTCGSPYGLNNRGQVVGTSDLSGDLATHPFLWDKGTLSDLGTLGGSYGIPMGINDAGEVVGGATNKNDQAFLAFLWKDGVMTNLGTIEGDDCSLAFHINSKGQIVGNSFPCAGGRSHAFLWENGSMTDLNALLPPGSSLTPWGDGAFINDRGEIAGVRVLPDGDLHAFLLIPCDENDGDSECDDEGRGTEVARGEISERPNVVLPESVRKVLQRPQGPRSHIRGFDTPKN